MVRTRLVVALCVGALLTATAAIGAATGVPAPQVTIDNFTFKPGDITVSAGTTVTWLNRDDIPHTVTDAADTKTFTSAPLDTDDSYSHLFATPGTYHYFCVLHPHMQGTIVVR